jgi:hypothetical protein
VPTQRDERDGSAPLEGAERPRELEPVHPRHNEIQKHGRRAVDAGARQAIAPLVQAVASDPQRVSSSAVLSAMSGRSSTTRM